MVDCCVIGIVGKVLVTRAAGSATREADAWHGFAEEASPLSEEDKVQIRANLTEGIIR